MVAMNMVLTRVYGVVKEDGSGLKNVEDVFEGKMSYRTACNRAIKNYPKGKYLVSRIIHNHKSILIDLVELLTRDSDLVKVTSEIDEEIFE